MLSDDFTSDTLLKPNIWEVNGPVGMTVGAALSSPYVVTPTLSFSRTNGMGVSGVNSTDESATIQSLQSFSPPFTLQAEVMGTVSSGYPFELVISSYDGEWGIGIFGNLNPNSRYYGISDQFAGGPDAKEKAWGGVDKLVASPSINVPYQLTIAVDSTAGASLIIGSNGQILCSLTHLVGLGPFYVLLVQREARRTNGPNQAWWRYVTVTSPSTLAQTNQPTLISASTTLVTSSSAGSTISATNSSFNLATYVPIGIVIAIVIAGILTVLKRKRLVFQRFAKIRKPSH